MHLVSGYVKKGQQQARLLGFPTANIGCEIDLPEGVYAAFTILAAEKQKVWPSLAYLKNNLLEAHLLEAQLSLYDSLIHVHLVEFIRPPIDYISEQHMRRQIERDLQALEKWQKAQVHKFSS